MKNGKITKLPVNSDAEIVTRLAAAGCQVSYGPEGTMVKIGNAQMNFSITEKGTGNETWAKIRANAVDGASMFNQLAALLKVE